MTFQRNTRRAARAEAKSQRQAFRRRETALFVGLNLLWLAAGAAMLASVVVR